jgi:hypothetical protein
MRLPPGEYHVALEFLADQTGKIGRWSTECTVPAYDARSLSMSDPILAWEIGPYLESGELRRGGKRIVPNTSRSYPLSMELPVYFEVYNLSFSAAGKTHYRVSFTIEPMDGRKGIGGLLNRITSGRRSRGKIVTSFEMRGEKRSETFDQGIRIMDPLQQSYELRIQIWDSIIGKSIRTQKQFQLVQPVQ